MQRQLLFLKPLNPISYLAYIKELLFLSTHDVFVICVVLRRKRDVLFKGIGLIFVLCKLDEKKW